MTSALSPSFSDLSLADKGRFALGRFGAPQTIEAHYPGVARPFTVQFHQLWRMIESGTWEPERLKAAIRLCKEGQTVVDAGAFIGAYSLLFAYLSKSYVVCFEPDPRPLKMLRANMEMNGFENRDIWGLKLDKENTIDSLGIRVDGIKIDVEGAEAEVLRGATKTIERYHPWILLELHPQYSAEVPDLSQWKIEELEPNGLLVRT